jgi:outer membrane protein OmpA-like peptidoglycan-associated protein
MSKTTAQKIVRGLAVSAALAALAGCATKGYVKQEMASLETKMQPETQQAAADAQSAQALARNADARTLQVQREAQLARDLALGNIKREEVRRITVQFDFDSAAILPEFQPALDGVTNDLQENANYMALVIGYTDATGNEQYNITLAQRRAAAVQLYLAQRLGSDFVRLATIGFGEVQPVADNDTSEGRARNRRAEVVLVRPAPAAGVEMSPTASRP